MKITQVATTQDEALNQAILLQDAAKEEIKNGDLSKAKLFLKLAQDLFRLIPDLPNVPFNQEDVA
ncbi:MAG: hypothetical protein A2X86_20930 [Bdellovibrionales bacterium GWA2_49_15]|nr:MAG: hypothetical protein A2X86_20930 [Bdellovibrionales bacterium GWA2_49_15]HAZ14843.1 hypothetical protein [Bdellovibrionales bacterium]